MIFRETGLAGAWIVEIERFEDERGFFARTWCERELSERGLESRLAQCSISWNRHRHTLRGLHYQAAPHEEVKLVRCTSGSIHDVIVDIRPDSPTFKKWFGVVLSAENRRALYIPAGFAHGFLSVAENSEVLYQISAFHHPESARGLRWNDPAFAIDWPVDPAVISDRDAGYPDFTS